MGSTIAPPQFASPPATPADPPQYMLALEQANRVRLARAAIKRRLSERPDRASSVTMCAELVAEPPTVLDNMTVGELLMSCKRIGLTAARKIMDAAGVSESRSLALLTVSQRQRLATALRMAA